MRSVTPCTRSGGDAGQWAQLRRPAAPSLALLADLADVEHRCAAAAVAVDRHALAAQMERQAVHLRDLFPRCIVAEIDRLETALSVPRWKAACILDVILRADVVRRDKHLAQVLRKLLNVGDGASLSDPPHQPFGYGRAFQFSSEMEVDTRPSRRPSMWINK